MEVRFPIGTRLRAYDFNSNKTCYAEGVLTGYQPAVNRSHCTDCERYIIRVESIVWEDKPEVNSHMIGKEIYPPLNGTPTSFGRTTNEVERI